MKNEEQNKIYDDLIDTALERYSSTEPRVGLEQRILANLATLREPAWFVWAWRIIPAAAALIVLLTVGYYIARKPDHPRLPTVANPPARESSAAQSPSAIPRGPIETAPAVRPNRPSQRMIPRPIEMANSTPRLAEFPSRSPLSEQERLLLAFVTQNPNEAVQIARIQQEPLQDLKIKPLEVKPIEIEALPDTPENK